MTKRDFAPHRVSKFFELEFECHASQELSVIQSVENAKADLSKTDSEGESVNFEFRKGR